MQRFSVYVSLAICHSLHQWAFTYNISSKLYFIRCESAAQSALSAASQFSHTHNRTVVQSLCVCVWEAICSLYTRQSPYLWTISSKHWNAISLNIRTCFFVQKYADRCAKPNYCKLLIVCPSFCENRNKFAYIHTTNLHNQMLSVNKFAINSNWRIN